MSHCLTPLQAFGEILPATHMVAIMRGVVLRNAGLMEMMPHVLALVLMTPLLTIYANLFGMAGGGLVAISMLDLSVTVLLVFLFIVRGIVC